MRGHVRKRGKKWAIVVFIGIDDAGKRKYKWFSGYETKKEAERDLPKKLQEVGDIGFGVADDEALESFINRWLEDKATQVRPNTMRSYRWPVNSYIIPKLGNLKLSKITPRHLQNLYTSMRTGEKSVSNRTIQLTHVILHDALDRAVKWGILSRNVAEAVEPPKVERRHTTIWTLDQALNFLQINRPHEDRCWIGFYIAIMTGMRQGEILALKWSDIDFDRGFIRIQRTLSWVNGIPIFQDPKTEKSRRSVAMFEDLGKTLTNHRRKQIAEKLQMGLAYEDNDLVIARIDGRPMHQRTFADAWYRSLKRTDLPHIRFHDLRHTHASILLEQDVHLKVVSERLGHSTISITADLYSHVLPGLQKRAADTFGEAVRKTQK
ncbi:site-specific integrase [Alicyclobacillus fastidiosus]|uniref:Site-specific integrase n=1 Tax=Alicyclobacillus fastidiosus TaxID=392011 RepID=A0ABY6ZKT9_9BACL|nr:tyrosine-type recombinase/integrase [Alicyclobacillus fastidiosus]WAH43523.1 site-specific integrase [Alicyclobacillus fastidiosus]GMA59690.1 site-specific integrase [Alicyclobacillus fastidiosus]GMA65540.1 site-specific integrase [Alicyclobacillus fastidiosus]